MYAIIPLVEGPGDEKAVPSLLSNIFQDLKKWKWDVGEPVRVNGLGKLRKGLRYYLSVAARKKNCAARVA